MIDDPLHTGNANRTAGGPENPINQQDRRGFAVVFVIFVGMLVVTFGITASHKSNTQGSTTPQAEATSPPSGTANPVTPGVGTNLAADTSTTLAAAADAATTTLAASDQTFAPGLITIVATVKTIESNGDLAVNDGQFDYTIVMSTGPAIVDLAGKTVSKDLIVAGKSIQITGDLSGHRITAQTIVIPTK